MICLKIHILNNYVSFESIKLKTKRRELKALLKFLNKLKADIVCKLENKDIKKYSI